MSNFNRKIIRSNKPSRKSLQKKLDKDYEELIYLRIASIKSNTIKQSCTYMEACDTKSILKDLCDSIIQD